MLLSEPSDALLLLEDRRRRRGGTWRWAGRCTGCRCTGLRPLDRAVLSLPLLPSVQLPGSEPGPEPPSSSATMKGIAAARLRGRLARGVEPPLPPPPDGASLGWLQSLAWLSGAWDSGDPDDWLSSCWLKGEPELWLPVRLRP